jgi:chemosensory pili system protein ChpA (sensor histidine kinase/response regulator)
MAGALRIGQNAHEMETRIEVAVATQAVDRALFDELNQRYDRLQLLLEVASGRAPESALITDAQRAEMQESFADETPSASLTEAASPSVSADQQREMEAKVELTAATEPANNVITFPTKPVAPEPLPAVAANIAAANLTKATLQQAQVGMVRVRSDILDRLVNQAGEVSIARTRMESEVSGIRVALSELTENVARLRSQLRELEIQAESQMESRMQQQRTHSEDFDPLEFDRFTRLQELTRLMAESVNDVATVQQNMNRNLVDADRDLITQARLTRDLTQDLMRVRMVPFDSVSDRLYRVVRQAGRDTGKRVNLDVRGGAVEVDRGVLERMIGPFEHLLRNAVAHGIERPQQRVASGKDESGSLLVDVRQEGNEMRITFVDDGAGLDFTRIRERAVQRGLITNEAVPSESDLTEMIFAPGFSTAEELTELSGRGVGMDVVRAESSSLGGRILVTSEVGKGTRFTIFLPLTLAVTQVVLVRVGTHTVALPSVLVAEVQQLKAQALAQAYNEAHLMSRGHSVSMHYLAELLAIEDAKPMAQKYSPIVVMAQGEERAAVHVDQVIGNREVVVKNIGPQLARVLGIAGATVLGSGEVVLIINPIPMAQRYGRQETSAPQTAMVGGAVAELVEATEPQVTQAPQAPRSQPTQGLQTLPVVMVVDDSLTVRRVTERLLTRAGYQVVLAKDGVDALRQLQDVSPDVMLVDIEMPRMDGFDLTRNVRGDARYQAVPIIMITSRTADKHRNFAFELGVNVFLGKPFQDEELLGHIKGFLAEKLGQAV